MQVIKEILRFRPPATMVPQVAAVPFKLTEEYTAPKGSLVIPSIWAATMEASTERRTAKRSERPAAVRVCRLSGLCLFGLLGVPVP